MYIEEITIEGFKSYAHRVVVPGFDPLFNAITGLNGSGKSNILDSICFVLGITNLSQVRANSLQDLVYKQGQAGVTKASVSIVFNNEDKANSPVGYEHFDQLTITRQLVIGGRNKYLINGHVAQPSRVQNLFHSVQLNVNNPHFLIMQGRITKVLNMKPAEVLGMLEEAAGTRMYETKKEAALRTLEKKQVKVDEIDKVLQEDILPALERLRREKDQFYRWQAVTAELDELRRFCIAYKFVEAQRCQEAGEAEISALAAKVEEVRAREAQLGEEAAEKEAEIKALQTEKELQAGGEVKELAEQTDGLSKQLVKDTSAWTNKKESLAAERANCEQVEASIAELAEDALEARVAEATRARDEAQAAAEAAAGSVEAAQRALAGAEAGDGRDESNRSLEEQLADARNAQTAADAEAEQAATRAKHLAKQVAEQRRALSKKDKEAAGLVAELAAAKKAVDACAAKVERAGFDPAAAAGLREEAARAGAAVRRCQERVDELLAGLNDLELRYRDPEPGFQRSRVKGVVAKLVTVKDAAAATALEVAAGSKLFQVVVDSQATAKALLSRGQFRRRVTIIPIDKVKGALASAGARQKAAQLSEGQASLALELVGFDAELRSAMQYVFGNSFVCKDAATAKSLAFHQEVRTRCITLEGDDFNPSGTLTGGSRNTGGSVLAKLHALAEAEAELETQQAALDAAKQALRGMAAAEQQHAKLQQELELKSHALALLEERQASSESAQLAAGVAAAETAMAEAEAAVTAARQKKADMVAQQKALEKDIANFGKEQGKRVAAAKAKLAAAKTAAEDAKKALKAAQAACAEAGARREAASSERAALSEQLQAAQTAAEGLAAEVAELEARVEAAKQAHAAAAAALETRRERLRGVDRELTALKRAREQAAKQLAEAGLERKKAEHKLSRKERERSDAGDSCAKLEQEYPWIASEKHRFGRAGSEYDFAARDAAAAFEAHGAREAEAKELAKGVNRRVLSMFEKAEAEYRTLTEKKRIVGNDKAKIRQVIEELDEKKREAVEQTWRKVNADFGTIFATLLPGTTAKLEPPDGQTCSEGLEIKVAFADVWKESLTELSGGQRSLLALSLILAMLRFKPAPIYILDEVDAALDLSHTQNIGHVLKNHFAHSQFLVVSLKEGLFNNANVIFRTRFVDGVSAVTRTANTQGQDAARQRKGQPAQKRPALAENVRA